MAQYDDTTPDGKTFLTDPQACPRPCFRKFQYYATQAYSDMINSEDYAPVFSVQRQDDVVKREYYTLSGVRLAKPHRGICLVKETNNTGKTLSYIRCYK